MEEFNREKHKNSSWSFNETQKKAILHGEGPLRIIAGPGSGKTEVLISRALKLILVDEIKPSSIFVTTFTEKAAENMEERIVDRFEAFSGTGSKDINELYIGTLHKLANDIMQDFRYPDYTNVELLDEVGQKLFLYQHSALVDFIHNSKKEKIDSDKWKSLEEDEIGSGNEWKFFEPIYGWGVSSDYGPNKWQATEAARILLDRASQFCVDPDKMKLSDALPIRVIGEGLEKYRQTLIDNHRCDFSRLIERFINFLDHESGRRFLFGKITIPELNIY